MEAHRDRVPRSAHQGQAPPNPLVGVDVLESVKALEHTDENVASLGEGELLANADARPAVEGEVLPAGAAGLPAFGFKITRVFAPDVLAAVQHVHVVQNGPALFDVNGALAVGATATGQAGVLSGVAGVGGQGREQAERLVDNLLQVRAGLEGGKGDILGVLVGAEVGDDGLAQLAEDLWVAGEQQGGPAQQRGGGIAAGEQDVEQLGAQLDWVLGGLGHGMDKDVRLRRAFLGLRLLLVVVQGLGDALVDEAVDLLAAVPELLAVVHELHTRQT